MGIYPWWSGKDRLSNKDLWWKTHFTFFTPYHGICCHVHLDIGHYVYARTRWVSLLLVLWVTLHCRLDCSYFWRNQITLITRLLDWYPQNLHLRGHFIFPTANHCWSVIGLLNPFTSRSIAITCRCANFSCVHYAVLDAWRWQHHGCCSQIRFVDWITVSAVLQCLNFANRGVQVHERDYYHRHFWRLRLR